MVLNPSNSSNFEQPALKGLNGKLDDFVNEHYRTLYSIW